MKILVAGAGGYIGTRLLPILLKKGHKIVALARNPQRLHLSKDVDVIQGDLLDLRSLPNFPENIEAAYYLVHSMRANPHLFPHQDQVAAQNFLKSVAKTRCKQIIYLSGLAPKTELSPHLRSRLEVEKIFQGSQIPTTVLRASIIIGSGSASFEIIRDLVEKLPLMITPKWVKKKCQPIAISDVLEYLTLVLNHEQCLGKTFEIAGPKAIAYKELLLRYAKLRGLKRILIPTPILSPRLSSYWLIFITSTNYYLARALIDSLKNDSTKTDNSIDQIFPRQNLSYEEALERAIQKIQQNEVISSWRDAWTASDLRPDYASYIEVPKFGCFSQTVHTPFQGDPDPVMATVLTLGGTDGYYLDWMWKMRGVIDRAFGGVGLRRGKTQRKKLRTGDALDFWRVLLADEPRRRLLLYAEMRLPGEAWLELKIQKDGNGWALIQTATFRPKGLLGRLYWYILYPSHSVLFKGMAKKLIKLGGAKPK